MNIAVRGLRNNNPFNIKKSQHPWVGKIQGVDKTFETFDNMYHGIRAGLKLLINYVESGFDTPNKIISRFAPCAENNVYNYVDFICRDYRGCYVVAPDERIRTLSQFTHICSRMAKYENGLNWQQMQNFCLNADQLLVIIGNFDLNKHHLLTD